MKNKLTIAALVLSFATHSLAANRFSDPTAEQKVDEIVSIFENSTPELQYSYIEKLNDGRGFTAGRSGFTTATGDLVQVIERYQDKTPTTQDWPQLQLLLPKLRTLAADGDGSTSGIESLNTLWKSSANDPKFRDAQDEINDLLYKQPARQISTGLGFKSALGFLVIYDAMVQHGNDGDYDSLGEMIKRTPPSKDEETFVRSFLAVRRDDLLHPNNPETARVWRASVDRVDALLRLVDAGQWNLSSPLNVEVWGDTFAL